MNQQPNREKAIFLEARKKRTAQERSAFLDGACGDDLQLRRRVEELLNSSDDAGSFLDGAAVEQAASIEAIELEALGMVPTMDSGPLAEGPGTVIGPYKLMEQIGEGGFGLVFVAEQQEPVRRRVALKLIKPGMNSRDVIGRFEAERQALALMDHPNIARVFDAGTTASGRPYFVMELVRGVPITEYCDQCQLTPRERLELFVSVCRAIQHAHQKGIIHRDVKPSNVLVTLHDGDPVVKVIDFGVAKALDQQLTQRTVYTKFSQMIGTPLYMSPEQAEMSGLDVDTRSDIYSLGVLLYELLTGSTPFDRRRLSEAAFDEFRRIIREEEPPKPSTRLSKSGDRLPTLAAQRKTEPAKLSKVIRGELDWIVMKALEKDRNRRYETANGFAADILRYLGDEAVVACPPTAGYRLRKFARRHKTVLATCAIVAAAMIVGTIISTWQAVRASRAENRATNAAAEASDNAQAARDNANRAMASEKDLRASEGALRERVYAADMNVVSAAYADGAIDRMNDVLQKHQKADQRGLEWYHWWRAGHLERGTARHPLTASFNRMAVSPDGKMIALSGWPRHLYVYDAENLCLLRAPLQIDGQDPPVSFSPDGRFLVVGAGWRSVGTRVLDTKSWETVATLFGDFGVMAFASASEQPLMALGSWETIQLWTWTDTSWERVEDGQWRSPGKVVSLDITPDGKVLVALVSSDDEGNQRIEIWNVPDRTKTRTLDVVDSKAIGIVALSPGGNYLAVSEKEGDVHLWKSESFSAEGPALPIRTLKATSPITSLEFSPDETRLVAGTSETNNLVVWEDIAADGNKPPRIVHAHSRQVSDVQFGKDSSFVYSAGRDGLVKVWDLTRSQPYDDTRYAVEPMSQVGYADDNTLVFHDRQGMIQRWDVAAGELRMPLDKGRKYHRIAISDDGRYLAGLTHSGELRVWNLADHSMVRKMPGFTVGDCRLVVSRDGRFVAYTTNIPGPEAGVYGDISLVDLENKTRQTDGVLQERVEFRYWQAFAPDSKHLVIQRAGYEKFNSHVLDVAADPIEQRYQLSGWGPEICAAFSPDGSTLAIGSYNYDIRLHDAASGELRHTLRGHSDVPQCLAFTRDGSRLVSAGDDATVRIWKIGKSECRLLSTLRGHPGKIKVVAVSPDGNSIASVGEDGTLLIWRTATQNEVEQYVNETDPSIPSRLNRIAQQAREHHAAGDWNSAIEDYTSALELATENEYFLQSRADARAQAGQWNESLDDWTRLVQLTGGKNADYLCSRGECFLSLGSRADASADLLTALTLTPDLRWRTRAILRRVEASLGRGEAIVPIGSAWQYSTSRPPQNWQESADDEPSWTVGAAPFRTGIGTRTSWSNSPDIWLRKTIELDQEIDAPMAVYALADDHADVYLNGVLAAQVNGSTEHYKTVKCTPDARLRRGKNTIAVHGHDAGWDAAAVDVGLYVQGAPATFEEVLTAAVQQAPEIETSWSEYLVELGRWNEAAEVMGNRVESNPSGAYLAMQAAILYAYDEDLDHFHRLSSDALERFGETDVPEVAERIAKACLAAPPQEENLLAASRLADRALTLDPDYWDGTFIPWAQLTKALAEYRSGHEQAAVDWAEKCINNSADVPIRKALSLSVLAMAEARLGNRDASREAVAALKEILQDRSPFHRGVAFPGDWHDWLLCDIFLRETEALLNADP